MNPRTDPIGWAKEWGCHPFPEFIQQLAWALDSCKTLPKDVLDIGYGWGNSSVMWLTELPEAHVFCVDLLAPGKYAGEDPVSALPEEMRKRWGFKAGSGQDVIPTLGKKFDFIFLDAEHTYEPTLAQLRAAWDVLRPGGTLAGHDIGSHPGGVGRAVQEFCAEMKVKVVSTLEHEWTGVFSIYKPKTRK